MFKCFALCGYKDSWQLKHVLMHNIKKFLADLPKLKLTANYVPEYTPLKKLTQKLANDLRPERTCSWIQNTVGDNLRRPSGISMNVAVNDLNQDPNFTQATQKGQEHLVEDIIKLYFIQNGRVVNGNTSQFSQHRKASGYFLAYFIEWIVTPRYLTCRSYLIYYLMSLGSFVA